MNASRWKKAVAGVKSSRADAPGGRSVKKIPSTSSLDKVVYKSSETLHANHDLW